MLDNNTDSIFYSYQQLKPLLYNYKQFNDLKRVIYYYKYNPLKRNYDIYAQIDFFIFSIDDYMKINNITDNGFKNGLITHFKSKDDSKLTGYYLNFKEYFDKHCHSAKQMKTIADNSNKQDQLSKEENNKIMLDVTKKVFNAAIAEIDKKSHIKAGLQSTDWNGKDRFIERFTFIIKTLPRYQYIKNILKQFGNYSDEYRSALQENTFDVIHSFKRQGFVDERLKLITIVKRLLEYLKNAEYIDVSHILPETDKEEIIIEELA